MAATLPPPRIHPSAVVDADAHLAPGVSVGSLVVIEAGVEVGEAATLLSGTVLRAGSRIGARCRLGPYAVIGGEPMDADFAGEPSRVVLEDEVEVREFATIHRASGEDAETRVGEGTLVMCYAHVSHNVRVGRRAVLTTNVQLGGHCQVGDYAVLGSMALVHQHSRVGAYAMLGATGGASQDVLPFSLARGNPARHYRLNRVGLERRGICGDRYRTLERALRAVRRKEPDLVEQLARTSEDVALLRDFIASSRRGVARFVAGGRA